MQLARKIQRSYLLAAAAAGVLLGFAGLTQAAPIVPYHTGFESSPGPTDTPAVGYSQGDLTTQAQEPWSSAYPTYSTANVSTLAFNGGTQSVLLQSSLTSDMTGKNGQADFFDPNLAGTGAQSLSFASQGGKVQVSFDLRMASPTSLTPPPPISGPLLNSGFGVDIFNSTQSAYIASLFVKPDSVTPGVNDLVVYNANTMSSETLPIFGIGNDAWGTYSLVLDRAANDYAVFADGVFYGAIPMGDGDIGGISIGTDGTGANAAFFDNFSVVPEPTGMAMVGLGSLLLLAKRPRRLA